MKTFLLGLGALFALAVAAVSPAGAQSAPPQVLSIGPTDLFQDLPNGAVGPGNQYAPASMLGNYASTLPGNNPSNALIGGDFSTAQNLWQRSTTVALSGSTYYVAYTADRWFAWGGTSTPATITQQADAPSGYLDSLQIVKATLTGVIPVTVAQVVTSADSYQFQGQTAELDCHLKALSGFSAANSQALMTISYGTATDEGSTAYAYGLNAHGGAGTTAWTGQVNASVLVPISTTWGRYTIVTPIPTTATEVAAAIGWTPVGTGTATDGFKMTGCQLVRNTALTTIAGTTAGTATLLNSLQAPLAKAFARRPAVQEQRLQLAYFYEQNEAMGVATVFGTCQGTATSTLANCVVTFPVPMRAVPTLSYTAGAIKATVGAAAAAESVSALTITSGGASTFSANLTATSSSVASGAFGYLETSSASGGGIIAFSAEE